MSLAHLRTAIPEDAGAISELLIPLVKEFVSHDYIEQGNAFVLRSM